MKVAEKKLLMASFSSFFITPFFKRIQYKVCSLFKSFFNYIVFSFIAEEKKKHTES